jgi:hypothetical protein
MKKLGMICLLLIIAIGSLGVVYAGWNKVLAVNSTIHTGNWHNVQFQSATTSSASCTVDSSPTSSMWPSRTIIINGTGPSDNITAFNATIFYTIVNNSSISTKIDTVTVSILSTSTMGSLRIRDLTFGDPLANFDYTNASGGGAGGGLSSSSDITPILVGSGNSVSGTIILSAPAGIGVNGKSCVVTVTFTSKASAQ